MPAVLYQNGTIPSSALDPVPAANDQTAWLLPIPALSFLEVRAQCRRRHGWAPLVTSAGDGFRSYERQVAVFLQRYRRQYSTVLQGGRLIVDRRVWDDAYARRNGLAGTYYRFTGPAAAVPGTSNHGKGITVDIAFLRYGTTAWRQLAPILTGEGWSNAEGERIDEPWHWNYTGTAYPVDDTNRIPGVDITVPPGGDLDPLEEIVTPQDKLDIATLVWAFQRAQGGPDMAAEVARLGTLAESTYTAVLGADAGEVRRDAEDDSDRRRIWEEVASTRADLQRADAVTRAQLTAALAAVESLAASAGADPGEVVRLVDARVQEALERAAAAVGA